MWTNNLLTTPAMKKGYYSLRVKLEKSKFDLSLNYETVSI